MCIRDRYYNGSATVDVVETSAASASAAGSTSIYAVVMGLEDVYKRQDEETAKKMVAPDQSDEDWMGFSKEE